MIVAAVILGVQVREAEVLRLQQPGISIWEWYGQVVRDYHVLLILAPIMWLTPIVIVTEFFVRSYYKIQNRRGRGGF